MRMMTCIEAYCGKPRGISTKKRQNDAVLADNHTATKTENINFLEMIGSYTISIAVKNR
jgi:hypothetical protein